jgi:hypothetical protein
LANRRFFQCFYAHCGQLCSEGAHHAPAKRLNRKPLDGGHLTEKIDSWDFQCTIQKQESNDKYIHWHSFLGEEATYHEQQYEKQIKEILGEEGFLLFVLYMELL